MINSLQAGRFLAAMAVVAHHAAISTAAFVEEPPQLVHASLKYGYLGVDFFFVLSGFIIHYSMKRRHRQAAQFAYGRLGRIMLPYLPIGLALALAYTFVPDLSDGDRVWGWLPTLTLLPSNSAPALSVAWTLQHELAFYLIYALLAHFNRIWIGLATWATAIIVGNYWGSADWPPLKLMLAPINIEFIFGVIAASVFLSSRSIRPILILSFAAIFLVLFVLTGGHRELSWLFGFAIAALLLWICEAERGGTLTVPRWLVFGGAASYAIYLVHNPLLSLLSRLMAHMELGWESALFLSCVLSALFGAVWYLAWERPVMKVFKRGRKRIVGPDK